MRKVTILIVLVLLVSALAPMAAHAQEELCDYEVQAGESLRDIADAHDTTPQHLVSVNELTHNIEVEQKLQVPCLNEIDFDAPAAGSINFDEPASDFPSVDDEGVTVCAEVDEDELVDAATIDALAGVFDTNREIGNLLEAFNELWDTDESWEEARFDWLDPDDLPTIVGPAFVITDFLQNPPNLPAGMEEVNLQGGWGMTYIRDGETVQIHGGNGGRGICSTPSEEYEQ